ncbi:MAG: flavocytochrome c [Treponema sp.]|nr:flavocytochrome c [Treponema sp.]
MKKYIALFSIFLLFFGCSQKQMSDGDFVGYGEGRNGYITLSITVKNNKITNIKTISEAESDFAKPAIKILSDAVVAGDAISSLDAVSEASLTSAGTIEALENAVKASKGIGTKAKKYRNTSCDIIVIGSGGAGLSAAVQAAQKGAYVILLEKMGIVGGNTNYSTAGLNASETSVQHDLDIKDSNEEYYQDTMKGGHNLNNPELVRTLVENSADAVDWLTSLGADLSDVGKMAGSTNSRTHRPKGGYAIGGHLISVLHKAAVDNGVEIRTRNTVKDILEKDGKVSGVLVENEAGQYEIKADAVIVATGGFGANSKLVENYRPDLKGFNTTNHKGATGDAFSLLNKFNVKTVLMDQIQTHPTVVKGSGIMITEAVRGNGAILVNKDGKRFANEMLPRDAMSNAILSQRDGSAFLLFDQGVRESLKAIEKYAQQNLLAEGQSISELADKLGISSLTLEKTLSDYNLYQKTGVDKDFSRKGNEMPRSLSKAPFYAVEVSPAVHHTMGGLAINSSAQVLNQEGQVIPGLYAAGEVTGGVHGGNRLGGNAVADIVIFGRIAGESASKQLSL